MGHIREAEPSPPVESISAEGKLRFLLDKLPITFFALNADLTIVDVMGRGLNALGLDRKSVLGKTIDEVYATAGEASRDRYESERLRALQGESVAFEVSFSGRTLQCYIEPTFDDGGAVNGLIGASFDITKRKRVERLLAHYSYHDPLTNLPNRALLIERLGFSMAHAMRSGRCSAVLLADIDGFAHINDTLGNDFGDQALSAAAHALQNAVRSGDTVARLGGDEFAIVLDDVAQPSDIEDVAAKLMRALAAVSVEGVDLAMTAGIGVAVCPDGTHDPEELLRHADMALQQSRRNGGHAVQFFSSEMQITAKERLDLQLDLRRAAELGQLSLAYQPIVDARGSPIALEALLRWNHPTRGEIPPDVFIPIAEDTALILSVGEWVLATACAQMQTWRKQGYSSLGVAVNLSVHQFGDAGVVETVRAVLRETGLPADRLFLEITESAILRNESQALRTIAELGDAGVRFSIDDFGAGQAGLYYLRKFKVDTVKIDRQYIQGVPALEEDAAIVESMISLCHAMGITVVGEGVETPAQMEYLKSNGCDEMQGYLVSHPLASQAVAAFLSAGPRISSPSGGE